jgi:hypothetical protein
MAPGKYEAAQVIMLMYVSDSQNLTMEYVILFITFRKKKKKNTNYANHNYIKHDIIYQ